MSDDPRLPQVIYVDEIDSTNNYAAQLLREDYPAGTAVLAEFQTKGRGRYQRDFDVFCPPQRHRLVAGTDARRSRGAQGARLGSGRRTMRTQCGTRSEGLYVDG